MHLARNVADPEFKRRGALGGPRLVAFTSAHAHYSYLKAATMTGLGSDNLTVVPCDANGSMLPSGVFHTCPQHYPVSLEIRSFMLEILTGCK